jgi:hypothetical protein
MTEELMQLKLIKISMKSFILIFSTINVIAGFVLGAVVTLISLIAPDEQGAGAVGAWAILIFPILNGLLGLATGAFLTGMYNFLAPRFGGIELEFEATQ